MSNSRRSEEIAVGVGESAERVRRMLPSWLMNCSKRLGVNAGPRPVQGQINARPMSEVVYLLIWGVVGGCDQILARHARTAKACRF